MSDAERDGRERPVEIVGRLSLRMGEGGAEDFLLECAHKLPGLEALPSGIQPWLRRRLELPAGDIDEAIAEWCDALDLDAIARIGGFPSVALGSDFDGIIKVPTGLEDASRLPALWSELRSRGWTETQIRGMRGENFLRVWEAVEHAAATQAEP